MTTLRPTASLWRRTRATLLAGSIALGTLLAPGAVIADSTGVPGVTGPATAGYQWNGDSITDATAYVTSRGGLDLRAEPARDADVLASIPDGTLVDLRIDETDTVVDSDGVTRWWPVAYGGQSGWVPGQFLTDTAPASAGLTSKDASAPSTASSTSTSATGEFEFNGGALAGATATVAGTGVSVNVRAEPSAGSDIVTEVADGTLVNLRIADVDTVMEGSTRWWPVEVNGQPGWISGDLLTNSNAAVFPAGSTAVVQTEAGTGAKLRAAAGFDADQTGSVPEGATVTIVSGPASHDNSANGWFEVDYNGARGYIDGDLLVLLTQPASSATQGNAPAAASSSSAASSSAASSSASASQSASTASGAQPGGTDNQIATSNQQAGQTQTAGTQQTTGNQQAGQTQTAGTQQTAEATGTAPAAQPTQAAANTATKPAQQTDQDAQPTTDATRPWETGTTPTATASATTPAPTPTKTPSTEVSSAGFIMPVKGAVKTQGFGCSSLGFYAYNPDWGCGVHDGIDFAAPSYTPIHAVADGTVVTAGWCDCGLGYYVEIDHGNGVHTLYGHMATQPSVRAGQKVTQGQEIGPVGSTGLSTGPHTHFMVQVNGVSQDPARYLP